MDHRAVHSAVEALRSDGIAVEEWLRVEAAIISSWQRGEARIPRIRARQVAWLLKLQANERRFAAANLPTCDWSDQHHEKFHDLASRPEGLGPTDMEAYTAERETHLAGCAICSSNSQWAEDNLIRIGLFPRPGFGRALFNMLDTIPDPLFPAALAAVAFGAPVAVLVIAVVVLALFFPSAAEWLSVPGSGVLIIAVAAAAGVAGGLAVTVTEPIRRRFAGLGDYVMGVLVVQAIAWTIVWLAPIAFGKARIELAGKWPVIAAGAAVLGLIGAYVSRQEDNGVVRWPFRALGAVLGPLMILAGGLVAVFSVPELVRNPSDVDAWLYLVSMLISIAYGAFMIKAAFTGRDPFHRS